jgi:hypothetical protein
VTDHGTDELNELRTRMAQSRQELRGLLDPPRAESGDQAAASGHSGFPRSRTMQLLMSSRGLGALGVLASGFLIARPALALRLLRMVPTGTVAKLIITRALSAFNSGPRRPRG